MARAYKSRKNRCTKDLDALVVRLKESENELANEKARSAKLEERNLELQEENRELKEQTREMTEKITELEERNRELEAQRKRTSQNSSKPPSTDIFVPRKNRRKKSERPVGGQKGHPGSTRELVNPPTETIVHEVTDCPECGASLLNEPVIDSERRQVVEIPPQKVVVIEHQSEHKQCPHCGCHAHGKFPEGVVSSVQYGCALRALMVYLSVFQLIPYDRICVFFSDVFGLSISPATLALALKTCNNNLETYDKLIQKALARASVLHVDETGFHVKKERWWLHVACTPLMTWYGHHKKRGKIATDALNILPSFKGILVHDFWKTYFQYDCLHAICNAHLIRELTGISEDFKQIWCDQMLELILEIKKEVDSARLRSCVLSLNQIVDFEARYDQILKLGNLENPEPEYIRPAGKRGRKKQSKARNLLNRFDEFQNQILAFMYDFSIPFDNNLGERDLRMMKVQQKISGTFRSEEGANYFCRIRGYISTVRKNDKPVLASIHDAFVGKPFIPDVALVEC